MIIRLIDIFYNEIISVAKTYQMFPISIDTFFYDPRFNDQYVIDLLSDLNSDDVIDEPDAYYRKIMIEVEIMSRNKNVMTFIADSDELNDSPECGDFDYYYGLLNDDCPILYYQSSHPYVFPNGVILYSPMYQIEIYSYKKEIDIYESVTMTRNIFLTKDLKHKINSIKNMLINSDRPRLDI